ncbi:unnamed protein product [Adineta ricciae]|uniref:Purinergic receptor n=1 Tax=Adineta ricciae TaxID=249248 RepID=A0A815BJA5_ADIRI|nr:unnamed protein product [Adineta ricciae]CAF1518886.1 unnamed protein product [Adineta ricciae]
MPLSIKKFLKNFVTDTFLTYSTVKVVQVPNTCVASVYRVIQFVIIVYIAFYIVWYKKGYQQFQEPRGTSIIKVKGITKVTGNNSIQFTKPSSSYLWDTPEYQIPPLENNAFFIATRQIVTYNQTQRNCDSAMDDKLFCTHDSNCTQDEPTPNTFGYYTGNCVSSSTNSSVKVCEINAWCPEELTRSVEYVANANDIQDFTVYLKTMVTFTLFDINMRNVRDDTNFSCRYDKHSNPRCPILRIGDILNTLNTNKSALLREGGLIEIRQDWTCNFDFDADKCYPTLAFSLLQSGDDKQSPGVNYRSAQKYRVDDEDYRILSKIYGLRFVLAITGKSGQFDIVNLFVAIGSGIGFMVIADIVCDAIFMYIHRSRKKYREGKFKTCDIKLSKGDHDKYPISRTSLNGGDETSIYKIHF